MMRALGSLSLLLALLALPGLGFATEVVDVRSGEHPGYSRLVFELDGSAGYNVNRCGARELVLSIDAEPPLNATVLSSPRIGGVRFEPGPQGSVARIELRDPALRAREMILVRPHRIVIDLEASEDGSMPRVNASAAVCQFAPPAESAPVPDRSVEEATAEALESLAAAEAAVTAARMPEPTPEAITFGASEPGAAHAPDAEMTILMGEDAASPEEPDDPRPMNERDASEDRSRISAEPAPLRTSEVPKRPFTLELGDAFLGRGTIGEGFELPGGAVWQPSLLVFGQSRVAVQGRYDHEVSSEAVGRLDLFANLKLSGTERILVGIRPLDRDGKFTGYTFAPDSKKRQETEFNARIRTLFFEGDLGELLPALDPGDSRMLDFGFAVGRQPVNVQEGMLIDDSIDSVGIVRNNLLPTGTSNLRVTAMYGWDQVHRGANGRDRFSKLYALLSRADLPLSTMDFDLVYVESADHRGGDGAFMGLSSVQRVMGLNTALRATGSLPLDGESAQVGKGALLFGEVSWTPPVVHDLLYVNAFWGISDFTSAARGPDAGGPLGRTGILFAAPGIGSFGAPLGNQARRAAGGALGYQMFLGNIRRQIVFELGGRRDTLGEDDWSIGFGTRFQQAIGQHHILQVDAAVTEQDRGRVTPSARVEWRMKF